LKGGKVEPIYKRIILKISGEAFSRSERALNMHAAEKIADEIEAAHKLGVQMGVVVGGGNIVRGRDLKNIDRVVADQMGMLATLINALYLQDILERRSVEASAPQVPSEVAEKITESLKHEELELRKIAVRTQTAVEIKPFAEPFIRRKAIAHLGKGIIIILACGTGNPFCSTDDAAILRALELKAEAVLKGTKVGGLYKHYPPSKKTEKPIAEITLQEAINLKTQDILDNAALGRLIDAKVSIPIHIFNIVSEKGNLKKILFGEKIGSKIF
jgi:uridylate kinase